MNSIATRPHAAWGTVNLLAPGSGLILAGRIWGGLLIGLIFCVSANIALAASLIAPEELSPRWRGLWIGIAGGAYVGAQLRLASVLRRGASQAAAGLRRAALRAVSEALLADNPRVAWGAIQPLLPLAESDLPVAYRVAQILTALDDVDAARAALAHVRKLDRHHIYREQIRQLEQQLRDARSGPLGAGIGERG